MVRAIRAPTTHHSALFRSTRNATEHPPPPPPTSATGSLGPLCGAVIKGEYAWRALSRTLETCPKEQTSESWTTLGIGIALAVLAATIYYFKDALKSFLTLYVGKCFTTPLGVITFTFANGRGKVVSV